MKHLPNILTVLRILLSAALLFLKPLSVWFLAVYALCGLTDVLDGFIARKTDNVTKLGATLDTIADFAFVFCAVIAFIPVLQIPLWLILWAAGIFLIRCATAVTGFVKFRALAFIHTISNKVTGIFLFFFPLWYLMFGIDYTGAMLCGIASVSSIEEFIIVLTSKELDTDKSGLFWG